MGFRSPTELGLGLGSDVHVVASCHLLGRPVCGELTPPIVDVDSSVACSDSVEGADAANERQGCDVRCRHLHMRVVGRRSSVGSRVILPIVNPTVQTLQHRQFNQALTFLNLSNC